MIRNRCSCRGSDDRVSREHTTTLRAADEEEHEQARAATAAGISYGYLWRLEAARQDPTLTVLEKLAKTLKVPIGRLLK